MASIAARTVFARSVIGGGACALRASVRARRQVARKSRTRPIAASSSVARAVTRSIHFSSSSRRARQASASASSRDRSGWASSSCLVSSSRPVRRVVASGSFWAISSNSGFVPSLASSWRRKVAASSARCAISGTAMVAPAGGACCAPAGAGPSAMRSARSHMAPALTARGSQSERANGLRVRIPLGGNQELRTISRYLARRRSRRRSSGCGPHPRAASRPRELRLARTTADCRERWPWPDPPRWRRWGRRRPRR